MKLNHVAIAAILALSGCASYTWTSSIPKSMRTVSVPVFRNESNVTELGSVVTRQILREFQREGTFQIRTNGDAALEIQGVIKTASGHTTGYDRRAGHRLTSNRMDVEAEVSVIDKRNSKVLIDNKIYKAAVPFTADQDLSSALRDASGRAAEDLARKVVDEVLSYKEQEEAK